MTAATGTEGPGSPLVGSSQQQPVRDAATVQELYDTHPEPAVDDEQHFATTVGMFVGHARRILAELRAHVLGVAAGDQPASAITSVRQRLHALQIEFGVLDMRPAQQLCQEAEAAVAAGAAHARAFPADAIRSSLDLLHEFVDRLAGDVKAPFGAVGPVLRQWRDPAAWAATNDDALAGGAPLVAMQVVGDFAAHQTEFVTAAQHQLALAAAALAAITDERAGLETSRQAGRALRAIQRIAGFLNLGPLLELAAAAAATLLDAPSSERRWGASDSELMLAAVNTIQQLLGVLEGKRAPERRQLAQLLSRLRGAVRGELSSAPRAAGTTPAPTTVVPDQVLSFRLCAQEYAIAVSRVREILGSVDVTPLPGAPDFVLGVIHRRGGTIPVIDLRRRFGLTPGPLDRTCMLIVDVGPAVDHEARAGCVVDTVGELLSVGVEQFEAAPRDPDPAGDCCAGLVRLRGRELRLLDLERVVAGIDLAALWSVDPGVGS